MTNGQMPGGLTPPFTPSGASALVPPLPWHYAGRVLSIAFPCDAAVADSLLPQGFGRATGRAYAHFCDWQATTDGRELLDPILSQYREFFVLVEADRGGVETLYCPFIHVDQDISMARGWLQGWPKKLGSVWITRSYELDHPAAVPLTAGSRIGATLAAKDRRLAEARVTLNGKEGTPLGFLAKPTLGLFAQPSLVDGPGETRRRLVRMMIRDKVSGPSHGGTAELGFLPSPVDELSLLAPTGAPTAADWRNFAMTVEGVALVE